MPLIFQKIRIGSCLFLLLSAVPMWLATEGIAPQIVQAYTARVDLSLNRLPEENYESILTRAQTVARTAVQRSLDKDILVTDVSVIVSVQNQGTIVPVLEIAVSRQQWRNRPDPQRWATYFRTARSLLFLDMRQNRKNSPTNEAGTANPAVSSQPANPSPQGTQQPENSQQSLPVPVPPPQKR
ncbi:MAG: hypothetical protein QNJ47_02230 [Nostocaceae cyanobacterium]|nr:hypothetical protein [Nostocaceae cyanobacterium]